MSRMVAKRVCCEKSLSMFVLLASLFLAKYVSTQGASETAGSSSTSLADIEGTTPHPSSGIANTTDAANSSVTNQRPMVLNTSSTVPAHESHSSGNAGVSSSLVTQPDTTNSSSGENSTNATTPMGSNMTASTAAETTASSVQFQGNVSTTTPEGETMTTPTTSKASSTRIQMDMKSCKNNNDCNETLHLICNASSGHCTCMDGYFPISRESCGTKLGTTCDGQCDAQNSFCDNTGDKHLCVCELGLTPSTSGTFCYGKPLLYRDTCDHDANCTDLGEYMECKKFSCVCKENYVRWYATCREIIDRLDAPCDADTQVCYTESEEDTPKKRKCIGGYCRCDSASGFVPHDGMCKKKISLLGAPCNATTHVCHRDVEGDHQSLHCQNGICQCKNMFLLDDGKCKKKIDILGGKCSPDTEICHADAEGYHKTRQCIKETCQCKSAFINENGICKQKISLLGAPCNASADVCYLQENGNQQKTHCKDGVCQCKEEFALTEQKCQKVKTNGGTQFTGPYGWILLILAIAKVWR